MKVQFWTVVIVTGFTWLLVHSSSIQKRDSVQEEFNSIINSINNDSSPIDNYGTESQTPSSSGEENRLTTWQQQTTLQETPPETTPKMTMVTTRTTTTTTMTKTTMKRTPSLDTSTSSTTEMPGCETTTDLAQICSALPVGLMGVDFWDIYYSVFSDDVLRALLFTCSSGHWCLKDRYDFWDSIVMEKANVVSDSEIFQAVCSSEAFSCLDAFVNNRTACRIHDRLDFTVKSVKMICALNSLPAQLPCLQHVIAGLHVTIVDILRDQNEKQANEDAYSQDENCQNPESQMTKTYKCMETKCPENAPTEFKQFQPWQWFIPDVDSISADCGYESSTCADDTHFGETSGDASSTTDVSFLDLMDEDYSEIFGHEDENSDDLISDQDGQRTVVNNMNVITGLVTLSVVITAVVCFLIVILWKRNLRLGKKPGYSPLMDKD